MKKTILAFLVFLTLANCKHNTEEITEVKQKVPFVWEGANVYFLLTDRFYNGNEAKDLIYIFSTSRSSALAMTRS